MRNSVSCAPLLNIHIKSIFDAFGRYLFQGGGVTSYCEAVRYQEMGKSVLVRGERCLRSKVDICEVSVADCGRYLKCLLITSPTPTQIAPKFHLIKFV